MYSKYFYILKNKLNKFSLLVILFILSSGFFLLKTANRFDYQRNFSDEKAEHVSPLLNNIKNFSFQDSTRQDTTITQVKSDTTAIKLSHLDSLIQKDPQMQDSSARLKYFRFQRKDKPYVTVEEKKQSKFFAKANNYKKVVELDSSGQYVIIKELMSNNEEKIFLKLKLEDYVALKSKDVDRKIWEGIAYKYEMKQGKDDLTSLISDITNIEIPLPATSFLSIFGPNVIKLRINGSVDIHGAWRNETTEGQTASRLGNTRNEPDFSQQIQISVNGTIGDKLTIAADWNTERQFEYQNQLKISYKGYDDEIVQSVEAGNVSLQTSGLVGGSEALFGIKSMFKMGPFTLTALASQKKSEVKEVNVSGGSEKQQFEIHAYDYSPNNFFLDTIYASQRQEFNFFERFYGNFVFQATPQTEYYRIKDIEIWKTTTGLVDQGKERKGNAFIDLEGILSTQSYIAARKDSNQTQQNGRSVIGGRFVQLASGVDYTLQEFTGFVSFKTQINETDAIGVAYRIEGPSPASDDDIFFGEFTQNSTDSTLLVLKLIKPANLQPSFKEAWKLQLRNIFPVGGRDVKEDGFTLDLNYRIEGQEPRNDYNGEKLLQLFGLDKTDQSGTNPNPDGSFDFSPGRTILPSTGEIIFPVLEPFGKNLPLTLPDSLMYIAVYDTTKQAAKQDRSRDKFLILGEYSASVSSNYNIGFNAVENSVRVTLNGNVLKEGVDYSVDYNSGQLQIRNDAALVPGADLRISYEQNDLVSLASKTLLGLRGLYEFNKKTRLGFSYLNLNQKTLSDKVKIGEEPINNSIYGVDFETAFELPFITKGLDYLISTRATSELSIKGEFAYMNPDPNTKKSTIEGDSQKSIAYIDDYEGSKRIIPIGVSYAGWRDLSVPLDVSLDKQKELMRKKGKSFWFNILPSDVDVIDIWPQRQVSRQDRQVTVLDYVYRPLSRGFYNSNPNLEENPNENWGGMMKTVSSTANNLVEENIEFIEFWAKIVEAPADAKINIDIGQISEDVIPNGKLDTEDKNFNDNVDDGEDLGIDGKIDAQEEGSDLFPTDPASDNFRIVSGSLSTEDYVQINGTQGNALLTDIGRFPDSEDLNRNFTLDRLNSFFRYEVALDTSVNNPFIAGGGGSKEKWYQFKIPLKDFKEKIGNPSFTIIEYVRLWVTGVNENVHLRMTELNFVGNQWQKVLNPPKVTEQDEVLTISTINIEDNPRYITPPGVKREKDRTKPDENVLKNEQSLQLLINNLEDGDKREAIKYMYKPLDVFNYKEMKMFIRGDEQFTSPTSISYFQDENNYNAEIYFRFGSDSTNYYEYRQPIIYNPKAGSEGWDEISVSFDVLTAIKEKRSKEATIKAFFDPVPGKPGHFYVVRGNPTLTRVSFFSIGIHNPKAKGTENEKVSGEIWVNELRVLGADDTPGWAYSVATSLKMADLMSVSFNTKRTDPYFHKLNDRFGNRIDNQAWGVSTNFDFVKLMPAEMNGSSLSLNYSHTESYSKPLYKPQTDILVKQAAKNSANPDSVESETHSVSISDSWSLSTIKFKLPSEAWYVKHTINSLSFGFNYNKTFSRNPTTLAKKDWIWNAKANYNLNFAKDNFFYPVKLPLLGTVLEWFKDYRNVKLYFMPQSFSTNLSAKRNRSFTQTRTKNTKPNIQRDFSASRGGSFNWIVTEGGFFNVGVDYNVDINSSLTHLLLDQNENERPESAIWKDIFTSAFFGKDNSYRQSFNFKLSPKLPSIFDLQKYFKVTAGYNVAYTWQNNFQQEELGRSAGYNNRINTGLELRLKAIMDPILGETIKSTNMPRANIPAPQNRNRRGNTVQNPDVNVDKEIKDQNTIKDNDDSTAVPDSLKESKIMAGLRYLKYSVKYVLFDYELISINFNQTNSKTGNGLRGTGSGFSNFWGIRQKEEDGPSRTFMLGLSNQLGPRAYGGTLQDNSSQKNTIDLKTSRPLWENAKIDINWNLGWGINKATTFQVDSTTGDIIVTNLASTGNIDRTFLSLPISIFNNGLKRVNELYDPKAKNVNENLANAFVEGMETFPIFANLPILKDFAKYVPRPNWRINWSGLEKLPLFNSIAQRVSLNHQYSSNYTEGWKINPDRKKEIQIQKISYGFNPLVGLTMTFKSLWNGNFSGNVKFNTKTNYDLGASTRNITETFSQDINISASYSKSGFELPLFGLSLKNDIEISLSYTSGKNSVVIYELGEKFKEKGKPQDGTTRTTIEPRAKYVMSSRVTLTIFYKRSTVKPEGSSRIPPTTTNEAGLDVHIAIQ
ncbi:MAG: cell surface protein SprA [Ignavibacteriales bacterium CG_4_9_14_3_um_filter_34_10]|nr:MAG: cell surface protein SprA [Ignavibacteriales bacterium CG_4_9_14_3_um_filter_34_10]